MKKRIKTILCLMIATVLLCSCGLNKVVVSSKKFEKFDKVALISTFIELVPATGLLSAAVMNGKINSISGELNILLKDYATFYRDSLSSFFSKEFNCEVLYGESLHSNPGFAKIKDGFNFPDALGTGNKSFPFMFQSSGDINPFKSLEAFKYMKPDPSLLLNEKTTIQELCKNLDVNYIVVSYTRLLAIPGTGPIMKGYLSFVTVLSVFDKEGDNIAWGNKIEEMSSYKFSAGKIESYHEVLDNFFILTKPMLTQISNK